MPEGSVSSIEQVLPESHTASQQWLSFELRMRRRRAERCLLRANEALQAGRVEDARRAVAEAREMAPSMPELAALEAGIAAHVRRRARARYARLASVAAGLTMLALTTLVVWPAWTGSSPEPDRNAGAHADSGVPPAAVASPASPVVEPLPEQPAPEPSLEQPAPEPLREQPAPEPLREQAAPEPLREQAAPEPLREQAAAEPPREQPAPELRREQPAPEVRREQPAPGPSREQPAPGLLASRDGAVLQPREPVSEATSGTRPSARSLEPEATPGTPLKLSPLPAFDTTPPPAPPPLEAGVATSTAGGLDTRSGTQADSAAIRRALARYEAAYSNLDVSAARAVWPTLDQRALARAFDGLAMQRISLNDCDVVVTGATARATCAGTAAWTAKVGGGRRTQARRWAFQLKNADGTWQIVRADTR
jgi:hypothetical protein